MEQTFLARVQFIAREANCDKYCWTRVRQLSKFPANAFSRGDELRVASLSKGQGISAGVSTILLAPYNEYMPQGLWRLAEDSNGTPLIPTDAQVAEAWGQALTGDGSWLPELTALPLQFRLEQTDGRCPQVIRDQASLERWHACWRAWNVEFPEGAIAELHPISQGPSEVSPSLKKLSASVTRPGNWVRIAGEFKGIHTTFLVRVQAEGPRKRVSVALGEAIFDTHALSEIRRRANYASMMRAIERDEVQAVRKLLAQGMDVDEAGSDEFPGPTPISAAATRGNLVIVGLLLEAGANPDACCCSCVTALHAAIKGGHGATVARLLKGGADPERFYDGRMSPLELAKQVGDVTIIRLIQDALARSPAGK